MSTRLEFEATTGLGLTAGKQASQPVETDATISRLPPSTTGDADTGSMTTPDGKTRSVARCMWQDHVAADFVRANDLRKSGDLKGSFKTGFVAALKAIGAFVATVFGTIAAGVVFWKDAPKSWDRSKAVEVLDADTLPQGEPLVSDSRTQPGLDTVLEDGVPGGDEGDDETSSVGSAAELVDAVPQGKQHSNTPVSRSRRSSVDQAEIVVSQAGVSGSAVATQAPDKKALKAAAKAQKAADEAVERASVTSTLLGEITKRAPSKLDIEQVKKQIAGSVGKMVKAYKEASKANAGKPNLNAHLGNVEATQIAKQVAAQLIGSANSSDDVLALHRALKEVAEDKGGSEKFVQLTRVIPGEYYPTTLADEVVRVVNEQGLMPALLTHMKRDVAANYDGTPESALNVSEQAMKNLKIAARRGIFAPNQVDAVRQTIAYKFAAACEEALVENLQTQDPKTAYAAFEASMNEAVRAGLLTEAEVQGILENVQGNEDIQAIMVASAVRTIVAKPAADDEDLSAVAAAVAPGHLAEDEEFLSSVVQQVTAIRASEAELTAKALQFAEARRKRALTDALRTWRTNAAERTQQKKAAVEQEALRATQEAARVHEEQQAQLLAAFDAQMKPVETAQALLQQNIELLNGSLVRQDQLRGEITRIGDQHVQIPVVEITGGSGRITSLQTVTVKEAFVEIDKLYQRVFADNSGIPKSKQGTLWARLMEKNGALDAASKAEGEYSGKLREVRELVTTIVEQRKAVWQSLDALRKLIQPYGEFHAANIGKLDADKQGAVNKRLEDVQHGLAAQTEIIQQIGVDNDAEEPVQSFESVRLNGLFGDGADERDLFGDGSGLPPVRDRANSVFAPAGKPISSSRTGLSLAEVDPSEDPLRARTPVQQRLAPLVVGTREPEVTVVDLESPQLEHAVLIDRRKPGSNRLASSQPSSPVAAAVLTKEALALHDKQQRGSRSLTASPVVVNQGLWTPPVAVKPAVVADKPAVVADEAVEVADKAAVVEEDLGNEDLLSDDESDDAGSNLDADSRSSSPVGDGKPGDVVLPEDEE